MENTEFVIALLVSLLSLVLTIDTLKIKIQIDEKWEARKRHTIQTESVRKLEWSQNYQAKMDFKARSSNGDKAGNFIKINSLWMLNRLRKKNCKYISA